MGNTRLYVHAGAVTALDLLKVARSVELGVVTFVEATKIRRAADMLAATPAGDVVFDRSVRQAAIADWCSEAFGEGHALSLPQRGIRFAEEAIETAQACACDRDMLHRLIDYVYERPSGDLHQEIGGAGITLLALAAAARLDADQAEHAEYQRVLSLPLEHFAARNAAKDDAGFRAGGVA